MSGPFPTLISLSKPAIRHLSFGFAKANKILDDTSIVGRFVSKYNLETIDLVTYLGSEMIGPSVQVAEVAGLVAEVLSTENYPFRLLDIFSGSGATCIPLLKRLTTIRREIHLYRVDDNFSGNPVVSCGLTDNPRVNHYQEEVDVFEDFRKNGGDKVFFDRCDFDLIIADPPHFLTLELLLMEFVNGRRAVQEIAKRCRVFLIYYAHAEQMELCAKIREYLGKAFDRVFRVVVGGEEMAICCRSREVEGIEVIKQKFQKLFGSPPVTGSAGFGHSKTQQNSFDPLQEGYPLFEQRYNIPESRLIFELENK